MSIPYWRTVRYTDDGCAIYQCLHCYHEWEGRGAPWWSLDGKKPDKPGIWNFCPVCGIKWVGQIISKEREYFPYYSEYKTDRLFPCLFVVMAEYRDGDYVTEERDSWIIKNPEEAIRYVKERRERDKKNEFTCFTYKIKKCI